MSFLASVLVILLLACLFLVRRRLEFLMKRDDADPHMDSVNDRRSVLCDHTSNTIGLILFACVITVGVHTFYP